MRCERTSYTTLRMLRSCFVQLPSRNYLNATHKLMRKRYMTTVTERTYYRDTYVQKQEAKIVRTGQDDKGSYVVFDRTLFHPQGGGQPDDKGYFEANERKFEVIKLEAPREGGEIKHYYTQNPSESLQPGQDVAQHIDLETRLSYARLHSAGHLLANAVEAIYPGTTGTRGNHFPSQEFVVFQGEVPKNKEEMKKKVADKVNEYISQDLELNNSWATSPRTIQFGTLSAYPCGGTHVKKSSEIGSFSIRNIKNEKGGFRVGYKVDK